MSGRKLLRSYYVIREGKKRGQGKYLCNIGGWSTQQRDACTWDDPPVVSARSRIVRVRVYAKLKWTAEDERAAIVAMLRAEQEHGEIDWARRIERGEHMPKEGT